MKEDQLLKDFMREFFPFNDLVKAGFFTKEMRGDYKTQAERVCKFFGYKTVYEYGAKEVSCHLTIAGDRKNEPFVTTLNSIYE